MAAGTYNLLIEQGATFSRQLQLKDSTDTPVDITGYSFSSQIRKNYSSPTALASFSFTIDNASQGLVTFSLTSTATSAIPVTTALTVQKTNTQYVWDLEATKPDFTVLRLLEGIVEVSPEVSR